MDKEVFQFLSQVPPFSKLSKENLQKIAENIAVINYPQGFTLSQQGKTTLEHIYIISQGALELFYKTEKEKILGSALKSGEVFGGISILMNGGLSVRTVKVKQDSSFYVLPKEAFLDICNRNKTFYKFFVDAFNERMIDESYASVIAATQARHFIAEVAPFTFLPDEELERIASKLTIIHYPQDTVICVQGQSRVDKLYIMQQGAAERYYEERNEKRLRGLLGEGDIFGGISMLLNDLIAVRTLRTTEDSYFYALPHKYFFEICRKYNAFSEYFTDTFGKRMLDRSYAAIVANNISPSIDTLPFLNQPVSSIYSKNLVFCDEGFSVQDAAALMSRHRCSSIFVRQTDGIFTGVVTDNDFRNKVIAKGYDIKKPISEIMSSPLKSISDQALIFEALMAMMQNNVKHLAVTDSNESVVGVVTNQDLLTAQGQSPFFLLREISSANTLEAVVAKQQQLPKIIQHLINSGAKAKHLNRFITTVSDAVLEKLIDFALQELGPPPVNFVFMIVGSEGRMEQTLKTDQDNAIIFEDVPKSQEKSVKKYFLSFGEKICTWLDQAGYAFCEGGIMAKNPKWCQPLAKWKAYFSAWIHTAESEALLQSSIFFDFRGAYGSLEIIEQLRSFLFDSLIGWPGFFRHLTENALYFTPPIGFFRNFVVESKGEHRDAFDIKHAMMPIVDFARIYALHNRIEDTNTMERLHQLNIKDVLSWKAYNEIEQAYSFLMQMRFVRQISAVIDEKTQPDNYINPKKLSSIPKKLSSIEQKMLKEIFKKIESFQSKLAFEFTGLA
jgi:CBS domain-containing protein